MGRPRAFGSATTRARWLGGLATCLVAGGTVVSCESPLGGDRPAVARVEVTPPTATVATGATTTLGARVTGDGGDVLGDRKVFWSSEAPAIATVSPAGVVTAVTPGTVKIAASSEGTSGLATITVLARPISLVRITPGTAQIIAGNSAPLTAEGLDAGGVAVPGRPVQWTSSDAAVATVSNGIVAGVAPGTAVITATIDGVSGTANVVVLRVPVFSVSVSLGAASIAQNQSTMATATVRDASGRVLTDRTVIWTAANPAIAAVDGSGRVTGLGVGTTQVRATSEGVTGTSPLTVTIIPVASVRVLPTSVTLVIGQTLPLTLNLFDAQNNPLSAVGRAITWTSSAPAIATVTTDGVVSAVASGTATITASTPGATGTVSGSATVNVGQVPVATVRVSPSTASLSVGGTVQLRDSAFDAGGNVLIGRTATWTTSNTSVATVSSSGLVTGIANGTALITATISGIAGSATMNVSLVPVATVGVTLSASSIPEQQTSQATAVLRDATGNVLTDRTVTWSSNDPTVAAVDQSGRITGVRPGTVTIIATAEGRTGSAPITVTATPVASLQLAPAAMTLTTGGSSTFSASLYDSQGNQLSFSGRPISWSSTSPSVATVNASGAVTAHSTGTTLIIASTAGGSGSVADTSTLTVTTVPVARVTVTPAKDTVLVAAQITLTAQAFDASNNPLTGRAVVWASKNIAVATVGQNGVVTGVTPGVDTITATVDGVTGSAEVVVLLAPVASVTMSPDTTTLFPGGTRQFTVTLRDATGQVLTGRTITWTTNIPKKASVSNAGLLTAADSGDVLVVATSEGKADTASVRVVLPVASVRVAPSTASLFVGQTQTLVGTAHDSLGGVLAGRTITWASNNTAKARVSTAGVVTAVDSGSALVIATSEGKADTAAITVKLVPVASITVTPDPLSLVIGATSPLTAVLRDSAGGVLTGRAITWTSSNAAKATVSNTGLVTAVDTGTVQVTATSEGKSDVTSVTVTLAPVATVQVVPDTVTLNVGGTLQFTTVLRDAAGRVLTGRVVTWSLTRSGKGVVFPSGVFVASDSGTVGVVATSEGKTGTGTVTIRLPVASISISPTPAALIIGNTLQYTATPRDSLGNALPGRVITWTTTNAGKATVSSTGLATAIDSGAVLVRATSEGKLANASLTIQLVPVANVVLTVSGSGLILPGTTRTVTVAVTDASGKPLVGRRVTWASTAPAVGTITPDTNPSLTDPSGRATATFRAVFFGATTISATVDGKSGSVTITVP